MIKIIRERKNTYCVVDYIYNNDRLINTQSNTINKNRFGAKEYKYNSKILTVDKWEHYSV